MEDSAVTEPHKAQSILRLGRSGGAGVPRRPGLPAPQPAFAFLELVPKRCSRQLVPA